MGRVRLYYNPECRSCATRAGIMQRLDWFGRVEVCTDAPPSGPLPLGAVAIEDLHSGQFTRGASAMQQLWFRIPLMWPMALLLYVPPVKRWMEPRAEVCQGDACAAPTRADGTARTVAVPDDQR